MKLFIIMLMSLSLQAAAHEHGADHASHENMESGQPLAGASLFQLESEWTDSDGKKQTLKNLTGKPRLLAMLYTRCQTACPLLVSDIQAVLKTLPGGGKDFQVSLFSFDDQLETPTTMKEFIKKRSLTSNWQIFKGDKDAVSDLTAALGVRYKKLKSGEFIHSNSIYLVNEKGLVTAQKEGLNTVDKKFLKAVKDVSR